LAEIAAIAGRGSGTERGRALGTLFARATPAEQDFLRRLLLGELRQGALEGVVVEAVARAAGIDPGVVRRATMLSSDIGAVASAAMGEGAPGLASFRLEVLRPLQPMLAQTAPDLDEALRRFGRAALEYKVDGARVQVHRLGDDVRIFTRSGNDVSEAIPELV